jgi:hypothetical protein
MAELKMEYGEEQLNRLNSTKNTIVFYVYAHRTADTNEIFYIGKGKKLNKRAQEGAKRRSKYWNNVVSKHGFVYEILFDNLTEEQAFDKEKELIALYGRRDIGTGTLVNLTDGGEGHSGFVKPDSVKEALSNIFTGRVIAEETRQKISASNKGKKRTKEIIDQMRISRKGRIIKKESTEKRIATIKRNKEKGKVVKFSDQARRNISEAGKGRIPWNKGKTLKEEEKVNIKTRVRPIRRSDGFTTMSITEMAKIMNTTTSNISKVLHGKMRNVQGYTFEFLTESHVQTTFKPSQP